MASDFSAGVPLSLWKKECFVDIDKWTDCPGKNEDDQENNVTMEESSRATSRICLEETEDNGFIVELLTRWKLANNFELEGVKCFKEGQGGSGYCTR